VTPDNEPIEVDVSVTYVLTAKGVAYYADKKLCELEQLIQESTS